MKHKTILRTITAFILTSAVIVCGTSCKSTDTETETELTEETIRETVIEETVVIPETVETTETEPAGDLNDDRYRAFFETQYSNLEESMMLATNGVEVLFAYADVNGDGAAELFIGDSMGVYAFVTEADGMYNVYEVNGWRTQYGPEPGEYIGNGCFLSSIYNGNNYGGEFTVDVLWRFDDASDSLGVLARLSGSWDPTNFTDNLSKWELYVAEDENTALAADEFDFAPGQPNYTYTMLDYGDNYVFADGELVPNALMAEYNSYVDARREADVMSSLTWRPVSEFN